MAQTSQTYLAEHEAGVRKILGGKISWQCLVLLEKEIKAPPAAVENNATKASTRHVSSYFCITFLLPALFPKHRGGTHFFAQDSQAS